jgi:hypothetical protein
VPLPRIRRKAMPATPVRGMLALAAAALLLLGVAGPGLVQAAGDGPTIAARALLQGHVRQGAWFAIAVDLENAGPTITGELRVAGGSDTKSRFGTPVELATGSRKTYLLYAQPPNFGASVKVQLVDGDAVIAEATVAIALHDTSQLVVGVVSENPAKVVGQLDLLPGVTGVAPTIATLTPADLPERIQAWSPLDRLVWQDVDTATLSPAQLDALRTWVAGGGRLVIVGGTAGADVLNAFPDDLLPYRPDALLDIDPQSLAPVLGGVPAGAATVTAYAGEAGAGRVLATSADRVIAAEMQVGSGSVTLLGFDPTTSWIAEGETYDSPLWRRVLPPRTVGGGMITSDDSQIVSAVMNLPSLALPPIGGLIVLLFGYIVLVGPVNYLVLKRLDRREWAWITVPALIAVFAVGSFAIGGLLRGQDVIVHEVGIVRGAPGSTAATIQSYLGVFSPSRATYQVTVPGDALLAAPINGDVFGTGATTALDVVQGNPSRVRDLDVGFGSIRTIRAEATATGPEVTADLHLVDGRLQGTVTNRSANRLEAAALVVGGSAARLGDIEPGATVEVNMAVATNGVNWNAMSERIFGPMNWDGSALDEDGQRTLVRRSVVDQISYDPFTGFPNAISPEGAMLLAWGTEPVIAIEVEGQNVRRMANVLYEVPFRYDVTGDATFANDLIQVSVLEVGANFFTKDPTALSLGAGDIRVSYRPIPFEGEFTADKVTVSMSFGGDMGIGVGQAKPLEEQVRCEPGAEGCFLPQDGLPEVEALDRRTGEWVQFAHMAQGVAYELVDAARWVDPASGELQVRFVNERQDQVYFQFLVRLEGTVE